MVSSKELMRAAEIKIVIAGSISVTLSNKFDEPRLTIRRASGDQREPDYRMVCDLNQWADISNAVVVMVGLISEPGGGHSG